MVFVIQSLNADTRTNTTGEPFIPHGLSVQDAIPITSARPLLFLDIRGPPESP